MRHEIDPVHCDAASAGLRPAEASDIPALLAIEEQCFPTDRMTRRNFRYAILQAKGVVLVADCQGCPAAYGVVGFHAGTRLARLTSFAVDPAHRGQGVARRLLAALEDAAAAHGCRAMRLEVRQDNAAAIGLYTAAGYRCFDTYPAYYEDDMAALRLEKPLP
ncbi:N-acetyltransferase [Azospirillum sp. TSO35-2]|uniref:GNAT family N-acetyltransferase n=1 Tax=Azospirillum sp. TSO35-2 TaxID=716796 RepID=UPI000D607E8F|nr:N-acetyltransferase [Azospirillum sp. TSO35-2]PWC32439.1 hypothetical protein TSO352_17250 [Azospirillum sp. TSO35-2]